MLVTLAATTVAVQWTPRLTRASAVVKYVLDLMLNTLVVDSLSAHDLHVLSIPKIV